MRLVWYIHPDLEIRERLLASLDAHVPHGRPPCRPRRAPAGNRLSGHVFANAKVVPQHIVISVIAYHSHILAMGRGCIRQCILIGKGTVVVPGKCISIIYQFRLMPLVIVHRRVFGLLPGCAGLSIFITRGVKVNVMLRGHTIAPQYEPSPIRTASMVYVGFKNKSVVLIESIFRARQITVRKTICVVNPQPAAVNAPVTSVFIFIPVWTNRRPVEIIKQIEGGKSVARCIYSTIAIVHVNLGIARRGWDVGHLNPEHC